MASAFIEDRGGHLFLSCDPRAGDLKMVLPNSSACSAALVVPINQPSDCGWKLLRLSAFGLRVHRARSVIVSEDCPEVLGRRVFVISAGEVDAVSDTGLVWS